MSGFVYIWYDCKHKKFYIGSHWGTEDDGYICSSTNMRENRRNRPHDFKRRIIAHILTNRIDLLNEEQRWLDMIKPNEFGRKYYNISSKVNQACWWMNEETKKIVSLKISKPRKKRDYWDSKEYHATQSKRTKKLWQNPEYREKMIFGKHHKIVSEKLKGRPSIMKGKKHNQESLQKMSVSQQNRIKQPRAQDWIVVFPDGQKETINNMTEFCRKYNLNRGNMTNRGYSKGFCINERPTNYFLTKGEKVSVAMQGNQNGKFTKGRKFTEEHKYKLSIARMGKPPWNKGLRKTA